MIRNAKEGIKLIPEDVWPHSRRLIKEQGRLRGRDLADIWDSPFGLSAKSQIRPDTSRHQFNHMGERIEVREHLAKER